MTFDQFSKCCPNQDSLPIVNFLDWIIKNAQDDHLKEHAYYTLSAIGLRMLLIVPAGCDPTTEDQVSQMDQSLKNNAQRMINFLA